MAQDNKTLGRFELVGIPPAPRGIPQIEVAFDIDANGIVHVSAKDLGTGKEQKIQITSSSGLSKEEIDKMVQDAESHAEADKVKRDLVSQKNQADTLVYQCEKTIAESGDQLSGEEKGNIESALIDLKKSMEDDNLEVLKADIEKLTQALHAASANLYNKDQNQQANASPNDSSDSSETAKENHDENVVDAEFEEVNS